MLALRKTMRTADQERKIRYRCEIAKFCNAVEVLPPQKKILFRLYFRYGYSMKNIAVLCKVTEGTISRRLKKIAREVEEVLYGDLGNGAG